MKGISQWTRLLLLATVFYTTITETTSDITEFEEKTGKKVICYYTNRSYYRKGEAHFEPSLIPNICTHYIYAYAKVNKNFDVEPSDFNLDIKKKGYQNFTSLKTSKIKTMISIGGPEINNNMWFKMFNDPDIRERCIRKIIYFLRTNNFDGVDLDLQFIDNEDKSAELYDETNFAIFIQELKESLDSLSGITNIDRMLLSIVLPPYTTYTYDLAEISLYVNWLRITNFGYSNENMTVHVSPLYSDNQKNVNSSINNYISLGANRKKILLDTPLYANSFTLKSSENGLLAPVVSQGDPEPLLDLDGIYSTRQVCSNIENGWTVVPSNKTGPYAFKDDQWMSFDNKDSITMKAEYILENKLGGVSFWALDLEDYKGKCNGKSFPLIRTMVDRLFEYENDE